MAQETKEIPFKQYQKLMSEICEKAGETFSAAIENAGGLEKIERRKVVSLAYDCIQKFKSLRRANRQNENKKKEDKRVQNNAKMLDKSNKKDIIKGERSFLDETDFGIETDIQNQKSGSLKRAIRKYKKRIDTHADKIAHPEKYVPGWELLEQREKAGTKKHWEKEIRNFNRSIEVRINELKARGDYDE